MEPRSPSPSSYPGSGQTSPKRPIRKPLLSKRPSFSPIASLLPLVASLRPGRAKESTSAASSAAPSGQPGQARRRLAAKLAVGSVVAVATAGAVWMANGTDRVLNQRTRTRIAGTPSLKTADDGSHVRWHTDIDVVIDKSFSDLAGNNVFGAAVNAWRATGALLPSISTMPGSNRQVGYKPSGGNENVVLYAPNGWPNAKGALGITVLTYQDGTGRIIDADLLLNGGGRFFAVLERDESQGDATAIDGTGVTTKSPEGQPTTGRFDIQSVVTHELGHFFGLGEDYDDPKATMYATTRAGEIHKRVVTKNEGSILTALYDEAMPVRSATGGCGRAQLARGRASSSSPFIGFVVASLGLGLFAAARRARAEQLRARVPVTVRRSAATRRLARLGSWLTVGGLVTSLSPPTLQAASAAGAIRADADVQIVGAAPRWVDGVVETELTFRVMTCHIANCPPTDQRVIAFGGNLDGITQVVGPFAVPKLGSLKTVAFRDGRGLLKTLHPIFKP
jgi:hypothetical protein